MSIDKQILELKIKLRAYEDVIRQQGRTISDIKGILSEQYKKAEKRDKRNIPKYIEDSLRYIIRNETRCACIMGDMKDDLSPINNVQKLPEGDNAGN